MATTTARGTKPAKAPVPFTDGPGLCPTAVMTALAEPTRLTIVQKLADEAMSVGAIADAIGVAMVNVSHHLGVLTTAGLLKREKSGRFVLYSLSKVWTAGTEAVSVACDRVSIVVAKLG